MQGKPTEQQGCVFMALAGLAVATTIAALFLLEMSGGANPDIVYNARRLLDSVQLWFIIQGGLTCGRFVALAIDLEPERPGLYDGFIDSAGRQLIGAGMAVFVWFVCWGSYVLPLQGLGAEWEIGIPRRFLASTNSQRVFAMLLYVVPPLVGYLHGLRLRARYAKGME